MRRACERKKGLTDRPQPGRPRQERIEDPRHLGREWDSPGHWRFRREHPRFGDACTDGRLDPEGALAARPTPRQTRQAAGGQGLRLRCSPSLATCPRNRAPHRPSRDRGSHEVGQASVEDRTDYRVVDRIPAIDDPLRTPRPTLRSISATRRSSHLLQETTHVRRPLRVLISRSGVSTIVLPGCGRRGKPNRLRDNVVRACRVTHECRFS